MDAKGNRVFAVDFDGTLSLGKWPNTGEPNEELFSFLIKEKEKGSRVILYTCRNGEQLSEAVRYCNHYGLKFDEVNRNLQEHIDFYGGDTRKINADYYIDDKAIDPGSLIEKIKAGTL